MEEERFEVDHRGCAQCVVHMTRIDLVVWMNWEDVEALSRRCACRCSEERGGRSVANLERKSEYQEDRNTSLNLWKRVWQYRDLCVRNTLYTCFDIGLVYEFEVEALNSARRFFVA
jgi:hypothetical protein